MTTLTVTAAQSGGGSANGMALTVRVLNGAAAVASQNGATAVNNSSVTTAQLAITPHATGSVIYGALANGQSASTFTALASTTLLANVADATNGVSYGTCRSTATTTASVPVTIGASAPAVSAGAMAVSLVEILAAGTITEDPSAPVTVTTTSAKTVTTASFTPPPGSLLVALVSNDYAGGTNTITASDSSGLTWTKLAGDTYTVTSVWVAQVPFAHINPAWSAARAGMPADAAAVNSSGGIDQFLTLHGITPLYAGTALVTPSGLTGYGYGNITSTSLGSFDTDQPFTMPGGHTVTGRVTLPLVPSGSGADVTVSLCADSGGNPGTVITSVVLPKEHLAQLAAASGLPGGALATASFNRLVMGDMTSFSWQSPVAGSGSPSVASFAQSGQYQVQAGGNLTSGAAYTAAAFTVGWQGGSAPGTVLPQPPLPAAVNFGTLIATNDVLVYAGGQPTSGTVTANVSAAGWSPSSGQVQSWTAQTSLPQAVFFAAGAFDPASDTVYVIGGETNAAGGSPTTAVWRCTVSNGQLGSWSACPPLPAARQGMAAAVINGWLVACGGNNSSVLTTDTWCAPVGSGGTIGSWRPGPAMPASGGVPSSYAVTSAGMLVFSATLAMTLTVTADGPGTWRSQTVNSAAITAGAGQPCTAFAISGGQYQVITISPATGQYASGILYSVPAVSVPLPATGLTGGGTYHILLHQQGGTAADYVSVIAGPGAQSSSAQTRPAGGGSWTPMSGHLYSLYAGVFDQAASGLPLHFWEDSGARVTTLVYGSASGLLLGFAEATAFPSGSPRPVMPSVTEVTWSGGQPSGLVTLA